MSVPFRLANLPSGAKLDLVDSGVTAGARARADAGSHGAHSTHPTLLDLCVCSRALAPRTVGTGEALVTVALQLDDGSRVVDRVGSSLTLAGVLAHFGRQIGGDRGVQLAPAADSSQQPVCIVANREVRWRGGVGRGGVGLRTHTGPAPPQVAPQVANPAYGEGGGGRRRASSRDTPCGPRPWKVSATSAARRWCARDFATLQAR